MRAVQPLRVLVAEDDQVSQVVIRKILQKEGHDVEVVGDGQSAVEEAGRGIYDLVFLDGQMPIMNGPDGWRSPVTASVVAKRRPSSQAR